MLLTSILAMADEPLVKLAIWPKDGEKVVYALSDKPRVSFNKNMLVIESKNVEINYDLDAISHFTYENEISTGVMDSENEVFYKIEDETIIFSLLPVDSIIRIYGLDGTLISTVMTGDASGEYFLPLSNLGSGEFLISVNGLTFKIFIR